MEEFQENENIEDRVLLVGVDTGEEDDFAHSMRELKALAEACGMTVADIITQKMEHANKVLYVGVGKLEEIKSLAWDLDVQAVCFDNALSPVQIRNLEKELELEIMDRTMLILEIFAGRARTKEAKLQVETARLSYMLPRLTGKGVGLSRQGGTSGSRSGGSNSNRGAGEKKLETDRRRIERRITEMKRELKEIAGNRSTQRKRRLSSRTPQAALVGYTNAGKSTIMNRMVEMYGDNAGKTVMEKDMLFATLDTAVRSIEPEGNQPFFLIDTVGFIHKLPTDLVQAFRSTLEEVKYADLLVQVIDFSDNHYRQQMEVTAQTLKELGAGDIPMIYVYNKSDLRGMEQLPTIYGDKIHMCAADGRGIEELIGMIQERVYADYVQAEFLIPYQAGSDFSKLCESAVVQKMDYRENGIYMETRCSLADLNKFRQYCSYSCKI